MGDDRSEFLTKMIGILYRLHETSVSRGEPLLAAMIAIAQKEAEDSLRHAGDLEELADNRARRSSMHTWRACDLPPDDDQIAA
jgi:cAMP phosphodiesterase